MTLIALISAIVIACSSLAWEFEQRGFSSFAVWILIFGAAWLVAIWRRWKWYSSFALFSATFLAAFGLYLDFNPGWMFAGGVFALFAWDMTEFRQRLHLMAPDDDTRGIERRHLARVSLLMLAGLFLASLVLLIRVQFTFEWGVFLVAVILLGLAQLVGWFKR